MQRLRTLTVILTIGATLIFNCQSMAASSSQVDVLYEVSEVSGDPSATSNRNLKRQGSVQTINMKTPLLHDTLQISASLSEEKNDYRNYIIQNQNGQEHALSDDFKSPELKGSVGLDYQFKQGSLSLQRSQNLSESPFASHLHSIALTTQLNENTTQVYFQHSFGQSQTPSSYFTDLKTAERKERIRNIQTQTYIAGADQIFSERFKAGLEFSLNERSDRPRAAGGTVKAAYALTSRDFLRVDLKQIQESRGNSLKDDRGYFDLTGSELIYTRYVTYDWSVSASYGIVIEIEDNPQIPRKDKIASDVYSLDSTYQGGSWSAGVLLQMIKTNVDYTSLTAGGQFAWNF